MIMWTLNHNPIHKTSNAAARVLETHSPGACRAGARDSFENRLPRGILKTFCFLLVEEEVTYE